MHVHRKYTFSPILSMREIVEAIRISSQPIAVFAQVDPPVGRVRKKPGGCQGCLGKRFGLDDPRRRIALSLLAETCMYLEAG